MADIIGPDPALSVAATGPNDMIDGMVGRVTLIGGMGDDRIDATDLGGGFGNDCFYAIHGDDLLRGEDAGGRLHGDGKDRPRAQGHGKPVAGRRKLRLRGGKGDDVLFGGASGLAFT